MVRGDGQRVFARADLAGARILAFRPALHRAGHRGLAVRAALRHFLFFFPKTTSRGASRVALFAGIITVVTTLIETPITFGILHMFAFSILLWVIVDICCGGDKHKTALVCLVLGLAIIFIDYGFTQVYERDRYAFADDDSFFWLAQWMKGAPTGFGAGSVFRGLLSGVPDDRLHADRPRRSRRCSIPSGARSCRGLGSTIGTRRRSRFGAGTRCGCMCCIRWCSR